MPGDGHYLVSGVSAQRQFENAFPFSRPPHSSQLSRLTVSRIALLKVMYLFLSDSARLTADATSTTARQTRRPEGRPDLVSGPMPKRVGPRRDAASAQRQFEKCFSVVASVASVATVVTDRVARHLGSWELGVGS
jgi:hypothetical protein